MSGLVSQIQDMANAMWDVANASQMSQVGSMTAAHGGAAWKFLAGGGPAGHGRDPGDALAGRGGH